MTSEERGAGERSYRLIIIIGMVLICVVALLAIRGCLFGPEPGPGTPTATVTPSAVPSGPSATSTRTPGQPTATATVMPSATATQRPTLTPERPTATATAVAPTAEPGATPIALRPGRVRVEPGDTLWGISCREYAAIPLRPGANPLSTCTCWPGLWIANSIENPRLILPGWRLGVPEACIQ